MTRDSALIYRNQVEALRPLPPEMFKAAMLSILDYSLDGKEIDAEEPVSYAIWMLAKPLIDKRNKNYMNGINNKQTFCTQNESELEANRERTESELHPKGERRKEKGEINNMTGDKSPVRPTDVERIVDAWNDLEKIGIKRIRALKPGTKRHSSLLARIKQYGVDDVLTAIRNIEDSRFLRGECGKGWVITFDWFVLPNNFPKVLEGNYADTKPLKKDHMEGQYADYERDWTDHL